jgi:GT2 family glycosyltransferase
LCVEVACSNSGGLPDVFNAALARAQDSDVLVFTHDDVRLDDWHLPQRLRDALARYAVVGVAGNRRRVAGQPSWAFIDANFTWDARENLSGAVAHISGGAELVSYYGPTPDTVKLLDGVFLAAKAKELRQAGITFDPRFRFHFYDLDFCRSCERAGLELGTWPIAITHASGGQFGSPEWRAAYAQYLDKWKE